MRVAAATRIGAFVLLCGYAVLVARFTLLPATRESGASGTLYRIGARVSDGRLDTSLIEVLGNVVMFVPFGLLAAVALGRLSAGLLLSVAASAGIELAQAAFLPSRVPSLADVEHNSLGALIGVLLAWPVLHALRRRARRRTSTNHLHIDQRVGV